MAQLTNEERIARIELAPEEMQAKVAKAYLRDDIDDEEVQYMYNAETIEEMNDSSEELIVENIDAEEPEGIGAVGFTMRTSKPKNNKNFITTGMGGWNTCVKGNPCQSGASALANCVGYASGRFNEIINEARDTSICTYKTLNCNAENFVEKATAAGLKTGSTPKLGAIMCWQKGATLKSSDGAGHVAIVERVDSNNQVYTSESGYNSTPFWNQTRKNNNGRWGMASSYSFRCFIYLPDDVQALIEQQPGQEEATPVVEEQPAVTEVETVTVEPVQTVEEPSLKVGDSVKIIGTGNGSSKGTANTAYGIGWTRSILKIWDGRQYPYQVGNKTGTTGFYKAEALQKK